MKKMIILLAVLFTAFPVLAQEAQGQAGPEPSATHEMEAQKEFETSLGRVYVGMTKEKLYTIYQESNRIMIPHKILGEEWIVYQDWTSKNPSDVITFYLKYDVVTGWKRGYNHSPKNKGSIYEYQDGEKIDKWFFPDGQSRWNGSAMNSLEWNMLTDSQKVMYLTEYVNELKKEIGADISIDVSKYILGLNHYADTCPDNCLFIKIKKVIRELLVSDGKLTTTQIQEEQAAPTS